MIGVILVWLGICAWQDVKWREIPNALTLPMVVSLFLWRLPRPDGVVYLLALGMFLMGLMGLLPGGDAKGLIAIALYSPLLLGFCLLGSGIVWLFGRFRGQTAIPGYAGFLLGAILYLFRGGVYETIY